MNEPSAFQHPGKLFVSKFGPLIDGSSVSQYAEFLRSEANLNDDPPIDLDPIFERFVIASKRTSLFGQSGLFPNPNNGTIFINQDDPASRQRFSEAHELMEYLFATTQRRGSGSAGGLFLDSAKERLCEEGASELLMPLTSFKSYAARWGVSLESGKRLAELYNVSLTAALLRAVRYGPGQHAVVLLKLAHKPSEEKRKSGSSQLSLFEDYMPQGPPRRLRVQWGCCSDNKLFIPRHKSIEPGTSFYRAYENETTVTHREWIDLAVISGDCLCESMPIMIKKDKYVLSIIHLPKDEHSVESD